MSTYVMDNAAWGSIEITYNVIIRADTRLLYIQREACDTAMNSKVS